MWAGRRHRHTFTLCRSAVCLSRPCVLFVLVLNCFFLFSTAFLHTVALWIKQLPATNPITAWFNIAYAQIFLMDTNAKSCGQTRGRIRDCAYHLTMLCFNFWTASCQCCFLGDYHVRPQRWFAESLSFWLWAVRFFIKQNISFACYGVQLIWDRLHNFIVKVTPCLRISVLCKSVIMPSAQIPFMVSDCEQIVNWFVTLHPRDIVREV